MARGTQLAASRLAVLLTLAVLGGCDALVSFLASEPPRPGRGADAEAEADQLVHMDDGWLRPAESARLAESPWDPPSLPLRLQLSLVEQEAFWLTLPPSPRGYRIRVVEAGSPVHLQWFEGDGALSFERREVEAGESALIGPRATWRFGIFATAAEESLRLVIEPALETLCGPMGDDARSSATVRALPASLTTCGARGEDGQGLTLDWGMLAQQEGFGVDLVHAHHVPLQLEVRDADGATWASWTVPAGSGLSIPALRRPDAPGHITLHVRSGGRVAEEPWTLRVYPTPDTGDARAEMEPNDSPARAQRLHDLRSIIGSLHGEEDVDWFHLQPADAGLLALDIETMGAPGLHLHVSRPEEFSAALIREEEGGQRLRICQVRIEEGEPFLFALSSADGEALARLGEPLPYRIDIEPLDQAPNWARRAAPTRAALERSLAVLRADEGHEVEDGEQGDAGHASAEPDPDARAGVRYREGLWLRDGEFGSVATGLLDPERSESWLLLRVDEREGRVSASLTLEPAGPHRYRMALLDDEGAMVAAHEAASAGSLVRVSADLPPGHYFVQITSPRGACLPPWTLRLATEEREPDALPAPSFFD